MPEASGGTVVSKRKRNRGQKGNLAHVRKGIVGSGNDFMYRV